jgi:hypothetical protein
MVRCPQLLHLNPENIDTNVSSIFEMQRLALLAAKIRLFVRSEDELKILIGGIEIMI